MVPYFPEVGLQGRGCKRTPKVPDVGAGDAERERVGEMLERRGEERAVSGRWQGGLTSRACPFRCRGSEQKETIKKISFKA